jgi:stearoyl-CoA desaturase (delta-9 desaturase)
VGQGTSSIWMKYMVAQHRMHHKTSDSKLDANSPYNKPFLAYFFPKLNTNKIHITNEDIEKYAPNTPLTTDWIQLNVFNRYPHMGIIFMGVLYAVVFNIWYGFLGLIFTYVYGRYLIEIIGDFIIHTHGYRNEVNRGEDRSVNIFPIGFYFSGEELHSNHHNYPGRLNQAVKWYEFDFGYYWIVLFSKLKLLTIIK